MSRNAFKEAFGSRDLDFRREVRVGSPDSYFQLHIRGVSLPAADHIALAVVLKSWIIVNIGGLTVCQMFLHLFHLVLKKIL